MCSIALTLFLWRLSIGRHPPKFLPLANKPPKITVLAYIYFHLKRRFSKEVLQTIFCEFEWIDFFKMLALRSRVYFKLELGSRRPTTKPPLLGRANWLYIFVFERPVGFSTVQVDLKTPILCFPIIKLILLSKTCWVGKFYCLH